MNWLKRWLVGKVVKHFLKETYMLKFINGKKTYIAGIGLILTGLGVVAKSVADNDYSKIEEGIALIATGLGFIGVKHAVIKGGD